MSGGGQAPHDDPVPVESPPIWYRKLAYSLDDGGTLQLQAGTPQSIRASDWSTVTAWPLEVVHKGQGGEAFMRIWIDEHFQQVRRDMPSCLDGQCYVSFDYVAAGAPAPPMLIPQSQLANVTWTEEDVHHIASVTTMAASSNLSRYGTLATRPAGWAWSGWQGTIEYDTESRPNRIDLTTVMPVTGVSGTLKGTLAAAESPETWKPIGQQGRTHLWSLASSALTPWFPGFTDPVPNRDFSLADAHEYVLDEYEEARQADQAQCTAKVGLGLVDGANSTVTPLDLGGEFFESENTLVAFGFPKDDGTAIWAVLRSQADTIRPARYEDGGSAFLTGATSRCEEFGTRSGTVSFYDFMEWAQLPAHERTADTVYISWHDMSYYGRLAIGTRLSASFGPISPDAQVSASLSVIYHPNSGRLGGGLMPAGWMQALDAQAISAPPASG